MAAVESRGAEKCPVDSETRQKWLDAAKAQRQQPSQSFPTQPSIPSTTPTPTITARQLHRAENDAQLLAELSPQIVRLPQEQRQILLKQWQHLRAMSDLHSHGLTRFSLDTLDWTPQVPQRLQTSSFPGLVHNPGLKLDDSREVSTIPRALPKINEHRTYNHAERAALPSNSEEDTGQDKETGNWVYPSQSQFFAAMQRKGHDPRAEDMSTIVPIHNAVNEQTWRHILDWEKGHGGNGDIGEGPKLVSFAGDSKKLTPRAWWTSLWGGVKPFDRHDWVVERADGGRVEYVIDYYEGKKGQSGGGMPVSFYLDVRPKLNSWEGIKARAARAAGLG